MPQVALGSWTPNPKYDNEDSVNKHPAKSNVILTKTTEMIMEEETMTLVEMISEMIMEGETMTLAMTSEEEETMTILVQVLLEEIMEIMVDLNLTKIIWPILSLIQGRN